MEERRREEVYEEIDLYELLLSLKRRWRVILLSFLTLLLGSALYAFTARPVYETSFVIRVSPGIGTGELKLPYPSPREVAEMVKRLDVKVDGLKSVRAREDRRIEGGVVVRLEAYSPEALRRAYEEILKGLNNYPTIRRIRENVEVPLKERLSELERTLRKMEERKSLIEKRVFSGGEIYFNPLSLERDILQTKWEIRKIQMLLESARVLEVTVEPDIGEEPSKPKRFLILGVGSVSGLFLGIFLALFLDWLREARRRHGEA